MSSTPEPAHLNNHHRNTLRQIFQHPVSHNIEWHAVVSLLEAIGSVVAHRMFDLFPSLALVIWVLFAAKVPAWAITSLEAVLGVSVIALIVVWLLARRRNNRHRTAGAERPINGPMQVAFHAARNRWNSVENE